MHRFRVDAAHAAVKSHPSSPRRLASSRAMQTTPMPPHVPRRCPRVLRALLASMLVPFWFVPGVGADPVSAGPTVRDIVEFKRIVHPKDLDQEFLRQQVSPDGKSAFIVTREGSVRSDLTRYEVLLLDLDPGRLE